MLKLNSIILFTILSILSACTSQSNQSIQQSQPDTYKITHINHTNSQTEYYGTSTADDTNIYFTSNDVPEGSTININDTITAHFDTDDDLLYIQAQD